MAKDELYTDLQKLVRRANQRILNIEKLTGKKDIFGVKDLFDFIKNPDTNFRTKKGRIAFSKNYTEDDIRKLSMGINKFLSNTESSTISGIKQYKLKIEQDIKEELGIEKKLTYNQANTFYKSGKHYSWIYEYIPKSEFWGYYVTACNTYNWSTSKWIDELEKRIDNIPDEELKTDLIALYYYIKE